MVNFFSRQLFKLKQTIPQTKLKSLFIANYSLSMYTKFYKKKYKKP